MKLLSQNEIFSSFTEIDDADDKKKQMKEITASFVEKEMYFKNRHYWNIL